MKYLALISILFIMAVAASGQEPIATPPVERPDRVVTEEVVLNVAAYDSSGGFAAGLVKEDLVIVENDRLHQPTSVRRIVPSVLLALDTGGEIRQKKNITTTRKVAERLIETLDGGTNIAVMQFHDRVETVADWTQDRADLLTAVNSRTNFGRRASFTLAIDAAIEYFALAPTENRHLVVITDGLDTIADTAKRAEALRRAWSSGIVVHVVSYTQIEFESLKPQAKIWRKGEYKPRRMPDEVMEALIASLPMKREAAIEMINRAYPPRLLSVLTDFPFIGSRRSQLRELSASHVQLTALADYTGGSVYLPATLEEMPESADRISQAINSQYIVTYEPKEPVADLTTDTVRSIEVSSRKAGVRVEGSRRLMIIAAPAN